MTAPAASAAVTDEGGDSVGIGSATANVTVLLPIHRREGNRDWLAQAIASFPAGTPYLVLENDGELSKAFNVGLREADTEFVLPFGADDVATPGFLELLLSLSWNADVVYPGMTVTDAELKPIGDHYAAPFCPYRLQDAPYITGAALMRRETARAVGGYRNIDVLEDWDLWLRMWRAGARFKACPEAKLLYRRHENSRNERVNGHEDVFEHARDRIVLGKGTLHRGRPDPLDAIQATFYNAATPATTYLRCTLPARHLPAIVRPDALVIATDSELLFPEHRGKAAVFQLAADVGAAFQAVAMRDSGIRVLVETDDNYLSSPGKQIRDRQQWGKEIRDGRAHSAEGHRWIAEQADGVIVTTEFLARQYRKVAREVFVCPNTVDPDDWPAPLKPDDGVLRIVWPASKSHGADAELVTRGLEWASRQPQVEVYVTGLDPRWPFKYGRIPWIDDLDAYRSHFRLFDIGVAPIKASPFALGRSDLKALEYAMGGCAPILSDVAPYDLWTDGENCFKAADAKGFLRAIQQLVSNRDETKQLAAAARAYVLEQRTIQAQLHLWQEAIDG